MRFDIYVDGQGEWRWRLVAANGRIVGDSGEGYATSSNAQRAARRFKSATYRAVVLDA